MKFLTLALVSLAGAAPSYASGVHCIHNDMYGFEGEISVEASGAYEIALPARAVSSPKVPENAGIVTLSGNFEACYSDPKNPLLLNCHLEGTPVTVTLSDGTTFQERLVVNLSLEEESIRRASGLTNQRVASLDASGGGFEVKTSRYEFGDFDAKPLPRTDFCETK